MSFEPGAMNLCAVSPKRTLVRVHSVLAYCDHTISWHLVVDADLVTRSTVLGTAVWVLGGVWLRTLVIWVERAAGSIAWHAGDKGISALHLGWIPADHFGNEREGRSLRSHKGNQSRLGEHRG